MKNDKKKFSESLLSATRSFKATLPILIGVILGIGLFQVYISKYLLKSLFTGRILQDTFLGSVVGSITAGNPINSYIIGKQLLDDGVSLYAVTAFIISWVTVGIAQLPYEISAFGKRFAFSKNLLGFVMSFLIAIATVLILQVI